MKRVIVGIVLVFAAALIVGGCSGDTATGAGLGGGVSELLRETFAGAEKDIARRKEQLIVAYNKGVETGASVEELSEIENKIDDMVLVEKGADTGKKILGVDVSKPETVGLAATGLFELGLLIFGGKKLSNTMKKYKAEKKGLAKALTANGGTVNANIVYESIGQERQKLKLPIG